MSKSFTQFIYQLGIMVTIVFTAFIPKKSLAITVTGADIKIDYIGKSGPTDLTYQVYVVIYTQCDNSGTIGFANTINMTVSSKSENLNMLLKLSRMPNTSDDTLSSACPNMFPRHSCDDISLVNQRPAFLKTTYTAVISLPKQAHDWIFYYFHLGNSRGTTSPNLCSPIMHVSALCYFNNKIRYNNSSPRFTSNPVRYLPANQPTTIYNHATDPDLDSIVVHKNASLGCFIYNGSPCPNCGINSEIDYAPGYTVDQPIFTNPANTYFISPSTGNAYFNSISPGKFAFAYRCEEYDRKTGELMGFVVRDVVVPIMNFTTDTIRLDSLVSNLSGAIQAPAQTNDLVVCPGSPISFDINANASGSNTVYLAAHAPTAPLSTFTVTGNGTNSASGTFRWTPTIEDIGHHTILIKGIDSACNDARAPFVHEYYTAVQITVTAGIDLGRDLPHCQFAEEGISLSPEKIIPGISYKWTDIYGNKPPYLNKDEGPVVVASPPQTTEYVLMTQGLPATCKHSDTIKINVDTLNKIFIEPESPISLCIGEKLELNATASGPPPFQNYACNLTGDAPDVEEESIAIEPISTGMISGNNPESTPFNELATSRHQYLIRASDLLKANMHSGTITGLTLFTSGNNQNASFTNLKISLKCTPLNSLNINEFESGAFPVFASSNYQVPANATIDIDFDAWYNWDTTQNLIVEFCYTRRTGNTAIMTDAYPTIYPSCLYTSNATGNNVCGGSVSQDGPKVINEMPRMILHYRPAPEAEFTYAWVREYGNFVSDTTSQTPTIYLTESTKYFVQTYGRSGCTVKDSIEINVSKQLNKVYPDDTTICKGDIIFLQTEKDAVLKWYEDNFSPATSLNCDTCTVVKASPEQNTQYTIVFIDELDCLDTLTAKITVTENSDVKILNNDTLINYNSVVQLIAEGAQDYEWNPPIYLDNPTDPRPIAKPKKDMLYIVTGSTNGECPTYDSIWIRVDFKGKLLIPNAFSPNGDGLNDLFKVENFEFQAITRFSVYNRYGELVYNALPGDSKGWDGTYNGQPADMGTYYYHIEIAYPDGDMDSFQGDINLIR